MNLLCAWFFITMNLFLYSDATGIQTIAIPDRSTDDYPYLVRRNEPLIIVFEGKHITRCPYGDIFYNNTQTILKISSVTRDMSTHWECEEQNRIEKIKFEIRVKAAYGVNVTVVGEMVALQATNLSVREYDGFYNYLCEEGDTIDLTCGPLYNNGHIKFQYFDAQGTEIMNADTFETKEFDFTFRMLVRNKNVSRSYVDCTYLPKIILIDQQFTYRIMFTVTTKNPRRSDGFIVTINDMKLTRLSQGIDGKDRYVYKFVYMESLNVTCTKKDEHLEGAIHGKITKNNNKTIDRTDVVKTSKTFTTIIKTVNLDGVIFQCYSGSQHYKLDAVITFLKEANRDTYVLGLSTPNILYEYSTDKNTWVTHYLYTVNQVLNLTCFTNNDRSLKWIYKEKIESTIRTQYGKKYINYMFHMNNKPNQKITCESNRTSTRKQSIIIILHQVSDIPSQEQELNSGYYKNNENSMPLTPFEIIGTIAGILVVTVAIVCVLYWWKMKRKILPMQELLGYFKKGDDQIHSLTNQIGNEYTYIEHEYNYIENRNSHMMPNDLYCGGAENNFGQRIIYSKGNKEHQYTEIVIKPKHNEFNATYAVPYETLNDPNKNKPLNSGEHYENLQREFTS